MLLFSFWQISKEIYREKSFSLFYAVFFLKFWLFFFSAILPQEHSWTVELKSFTRLPQKKVVLVRVWLVSKKCTEIVLCLITSSVLDKKETTAASKMSVQSAPDTKCYSTLLCSSWQVFLRWLMKLTGVVASTASENTRFATVCRKSEWKRKKDCTSCGGILCVLSKTDLSFFQKLFYFNTKNTSTSALHFLQWSIYAK